MMMESFFATLKKERIYLEEYADAGPGTHECVRLHRAVLQSSASSLGVGLRES